jgi:hypothetical protein
MQLSHVTLEFGADVGEGGAEQILNGQVRYLLRGGFRDQPPNVVQADQVKLLDSLKSVRN